MKVQPVAENGIIFNFYFTFAGDKTIQSINGSKQLKPLLTTLLSTLSKKKKKTTTPLTVQLSTPLCVRQVEWKAQTLTD